ncbi:unnamed protein product [Eruca vesicaria subsp. sativa]|uniref:Adaptor AP-1 19 kDa protein n=1 Tax=Eruca vesicaria subsp. sativa TaxID=29727 RepID=A0ABC8K023_ERUVS|nr:unnamed protein product [Eruca vesicaria subsp. sativa]
MICIHLTEEGPCEELGPDGKPSSFNEFILPAKEFDGLRERCVSEPGPDLVVKHLIYESGLKQRLLRYAASALLFTQKGANPNLVSWNSRQGKVRLTKWYSPYTQKERSKVIRELSGVILNRGPKLCNFVEWRGYKVVYKRYTSLYFCMCIDQEDNELEVLEIIHHYYFGSVCELDLIFNFHKAYYILDELLIAGELQESSKKTVARIISAQDQMVEAAKEEAGSISNIIAQASK